VSGGEVVVVATGTANTASVAAAFERLGRRVRVEDRAGEVRDAGRVVLPGVGALAAAMERLEGLELAPVLRERVEAGRPTLAICLGLQLLSEESEESPGVGGLGVLPGRVERLRGEVRLPHLGWNRVSAEPGCELLEDGYAAFAHGYALREAPPGWRAARCVHGEPFVAALERGAVLACQFHPELSGAYGAALLERWLERGGASC
jgi:glutamine amidotransferase